MKVLVTGASGFVGRHLVPALAVDHEVIAAVRMAGRAPEGCAEVVVGDIDGTTDWAGLLEGVDAVVHLAARVHVMDEHAADPLAAYRAVNRDGTVALARAAVAAGVKRFVFVSSIAVNGPPERGTRLTSDLPPNPRTPYGVSKMEAEDGLRQVVSETAMSAVVLRPPVVYGPGAGGNIGRIASAVARGVPLPLASVRNSRTMIAIDNLVAAIVAATSIQSAPDHVILVADTHGVSTPDLVRFVARGKGHRARLLPLPVLLLRGLFTVLGRREDIERLTEDFLIDADWGTLGIDTSALLAPEEALVEVGRTWNELLGR